MAQLSFHYLVQIIKAAPLKEKDVWVRLKIKVQSKISYMRTGGDHHKSPVRNQIKINNI